MASQLTREEVERIADLARLELSPDETAQFARQLTTILDYAAQVQQVDTRGVPPAGATGAATVWREDEPRESTARDVALGQAPDAAPEAGLFRVPKVI